MFDKIISKIAKRLDAVNIPYMVMGGQAILHYGEPRLTKDIDITLGVGTEELPTIQCLISKSGLTSLVKSPKEFIKRTNVLPVIDRKSGIRVDFIFSDSLFEKRAIKRARVVRIDNQSVRIASVEDLIIQKIVAGRPRDIEDVENILLKQQNLDVRYITKWLKQFEGALNISMVRIFAGLRRKSRRELHKHKL